MAVSVSSLMNILNASSPFVAPAAKKDDSSTKVTPSVLVSNGPRQNALSPASSLISQPVSSFLLAVQADDYEPPEPSSDNVGNTVAGGFSSAAPSAAILHPTLPSTGGFKTVKAKSFASPTPADFGRATAAFAKSNRLSGGNSFNASDTAKLNAFA